MNVGKYFLDMFDVGLKTHTSEKYFFGYFGFNEMMRDIQKNYKTC